MRVSMTGSLILLSLAVLGSGLGPPQSRAGEVPLVNESLVEGSVDEIWPLITTKKGMESWMVAHAEVDLRAGGLLRTNHDPNGKIGDEQTVTNRI